MKIVSIPQDFNEFRSLSRTLLAQEISPTQLDFRANNELRLLSASGYRMDSQINQASTLRISPKKMRWLQNIAMFRSDDVWHLLYRLLWKIRSNAKILDNPADPDVIEGERRAKQVSRDIHKMHAFVRFNKMTIEDEEHFFAWHKPQHKIVRAGAIFFKRRFGSMRWSILSPDESVHWDLENLRFTEGVATQPTFSDSVEAHWLTYYRSIFNPARIKIKAMKKEMPVRYWESMPETRIITQLLKEAPARIEQMRLAAQPRAIVPQSKSLSELEAPCRECKSCPIACLGGKAVFGEGDEGARVMLVGEQPGDEEDLVGRPFVGPAGKILNQILQNCNLDRSKLYITNAVKHFKWEPRGKRRLHQRPNGSEILACRPWLLAELETVKPEAIVCLGATAAQSVLGIKIGVSESLEKVFRGPNGIKVFVTYHPSAILRSITQEKKDEISTAISGSLVRVMRMELALKSEN